MQRERRARTELRRDTARECDHPALGVMSVGVNLKNPFVGSMTNELSTEIQGSGHFDVGIALRRSRINVKHI